MPPRTRTTRPLKKHENIKENVNATRKTKTRIIKKSNKKPLADRTNSASDDNTSVIIRKEVNRNDVASCSSLDQKLIIKERPQRVRRLPLRYEENDILKNMSNNSSPSNINSLKAQNNKIPVVILSPLNNAIQIENGPITNKKNFRRTRNKKEANIQETINSFVLKSKKNECTESVSPIKECNEVFSHTYEKIKRIPAKDFKSKNRTNFIQPVSASTPLSKKPSTRSNPADICENLGNLSKCKEKRNYKQTRNKYETNNNVYKHQTIDSCVLKSRKDESAKNTSPSNKLCTENTSRKTNIVYKMGRKIPVKDISMRLLESKRKPLKRESGKVDVYEFTFDPNEEPPPLKKKKKKIVKNVNRPKRVVKSSYEKNLEKALALLKKTVSTKAPVSEEIRTLKQQNDKIDMTFTNPINNEIVNQQNKILTMNSGISNVSAISENKYHSIQVEDIALQFQESNDNHNIDYSPVNSPNQCPPSPVYEDNDAADKPINNKDPLNLQDNLSFFDEQPIANSSMNTSVRHPSASPWRVEFTNLPLKWQVNTYVKPNLTPAVERSYVNFNDSKNKHLYTNIIEESNEILPQIVEDTPTLKQTSIISFIKEQAEKKVNQKKRNKIIQNSSLFNDVTNTMENLVSRCNDTIPETIPEEFSEKSSSSNNLQPEKENSHLHISLVENNKVDEAIEKVNDKNITYFGFDDSENQENISPTKKMKKAKGLKSRANGILQEINEERNINRNAGRPVAAKSKPARTVPGDDTLFEFKSATEAPVIHDDNVNNDVEITDSNLEMDDSQSVHLFEDIDTVHHLKPSRKSYGKAKKVTFRQNSGINDSDSNVENKGSDNEDDTDDVSFKLPTVKQKRTNIKRISKKQQKSKKEDKEAEAWAAGFNSMCEDIEEFDLVIE